MIATTWQIAIMVTVLAGLLWMAMRPSRRRGARGPSNGRSWSADATYNIGDGGRHHIGGGPYHDSSSHHSPSDLSSPAGDSGSTGDAGGGDGGGGGSSD